MNAHQAAECRRLAALGVSIIKRPWGAYDGIDPEGNPGVYTFKKGMSGSDTCQVNPLVASKSTVSSAIARAGMAVQRAFRSSSGGAQLAQTLKELATKN